MNYTLESFIDFCDGMEIAEESAGTKAISKKLNVTKSKMSTLSKKIEKAKTPQEALTYWKQYRQVVAEAQEYVNAMNVTDSEKATQTIIGILIAMFTSPFGLPFGILKSYRAINSMNANAYFEKALQMADARIKTLTLATQKQTANEAYSLYDVDYDIASESIMDAVTATKVSLKLKCDIEKCNTEISTASTSQEAIVGWEKYLRLVDAAEKTIDSLNYSEDDRKITLIGSIVALLFIPFAGLPIGIGGLYAMNSVKRAKELIITARDNAKSNIELLEDIE